MSIESAATSVRWSRYAEQAAQDLAENRRRQAELMSHLDVLRQEEDLLQDILNRAGQAASSETGEVTRQQQQAEDESTPALQGSAQDAPEPRHESTTPSVSGTQQPLLRDLLLQLLCTHDEPCHARNIREELVEKFPDREPTAQVVRNTLETLVARGRVIRHKLDRSVMYTVTEAARQEVRTLQESRGAA
ncbi:hypothetical protein ACWD3J_42845 [Streptomyces sp. NPDC002755]